MFGEKLIPVNNHLSKTDNKLWLEDHFHKFEIGGID